MNDIRSQATRARDSIVDYLERNGVSFKVQRLWAFGLTIFIGGLLLLSFWSLEPVGEEEEEEPPADVEEDIQVLDARPWFDKIPMPPIAVATSNTLPEGACKRQLKRYLEELGNGTLWATQMFDASVKYPYGIIDGQTRHMGSFDQCYRIKARAGNEGCIGDVYGRYCLVDFKYQRKDETRGSGGKLDLDFDPSDSVWEAIKEKGDFRRVKRYMLQMALCVPAGCTASDVQQSLQGPYGEFGEANDLAIQVSVEGNNCQSQLDKPYFSFGAIVYSLAVLCVIVLVVLASLSDDLSMSDGEVQSGPLAAQLLLCFSARRNIRSVLEIRHRHRGLDAIHMFRLLSTCFVIFGHRGFVYYLNPLVNERHFEMTFDVPSFIMFYNGPILVDGFFAIGGLLTCHSILDQYEKTKRVDIAGFILIRILRLTPVYAFILFFNAYIFRHLGSGPLWESIVGLEADNCASAWWAHLLYLNNYLTMDRICVFQSWYLAVDFQCYVLTVFLVTEFCKRPRRIGYKILGSVTYVSILIPFVVTFVNRVRPLLIVYPYISHLSMDAYFRDYYVKTHLRMTAYLVGVIAGVILYDCERSSYRIPKRYSKILFVLLYVVLTHAAQALGYPYLNPNSNPSSLSMALYASLHRGAYAAGVCSLVLLIAIADGLDSQYRFFGADWAQPLARLTYGAFLSHNILQAYQAASARSARTFSAHNLIWDIVPDIVFSFSLAFVIVVFIESPFRRLEKLIVSRYQLKKCGMTDEARKKPAGKKLD